MRKMECLLIADDLTGACDSAVHFVAAGMRTWVPLGVEPAPTDAKVIACSTESRDIDPAEAVCRIRRLAGAMRSREPRIIFKKIDSVLRGNTGMEIVAALEAFACDAAVVNPAFPAMGRVVSSGALRVPCDAGFAPVALAPWLRAHGACDCAHALPGSVADAIDAGARFVSTDAVCHNDLDALAAETLACGRRILWAGSGGLARALARHLASAPEPPLEAAPIRGPVLFCVGSDHPVTVEQQRRLVEQRPGQHAVLAIPCGSLGADVLRESLSVRRPAALFVTGGETASLVCAAINAQSIELKREFLPGIPLGILHGGSLHGLPLLTKSGGFGAPDDLIRIADYFHA